MVTCGRPFVVTYSCEKRAIYCRCWYGTLTAELVGPARDVNAAFVNTPRLWSCRSLLFALRSSTPGREQVKAAVRQAPQLWPAEHMRVSRGLRRTSRRRTCWASAPARSSSPWRWAPRRRCLCRWAHTRCTRPRGACPARPSRRPPRRSGSTWPSWCGPCPEPCLHVQHVAYLRALFLPVSAASPSAGVVPARRAGAMSPSMMGLTPRCWW